MTCTIGLVESGRVYLAADSAASYDTQLRARRWPKVFNNGGFVIGYCGSFRAGQLIQHGLYMPDEVGRRDTEAYMVNVFPREVRATLKAHDAEDSFDDTDLLVGINGRLFRVESDYHVGEVSDPFDAVGTGEEIAVGTMYTLHKLKVDLPPRKKLRFAIDAAARYTTNVAGPVHYAEEAER